MEVRKSREVLRAALTLAKEFCKYHGAEAILQERRQVITQLRNEIIELRATDLEKFQESFDLKTIPPEWFEKLRRDICAPEHPRSISYVKLFGHQHQRQQKMLEPTRPDFDTQ